MYYRSQCGEDIWLDQHLDLRSGFFVEVGAADGVLFSNTYMLEKKYGWKGLLVEPDTRHVWGDRPLSIKDRSVISGYPQVSFGCHEHDAQFSGILCDSSMRLLLSAKTLDGVLADYGIEEVRLLSIDTEGTELDVWSTCSIRPEIVIIEHSTPGVPNSLEKCRDTFLQDKYDEVFLTAYNAIYRRYV